MSLLRRLLEWLAPPRKVRIAVEGCFAARGFQDCIVWGHIGRTWFCARGGGGVWRFAPQGERCPGWLEAELAKAIEHFRAEAANDTQP